MFDPKKSGMVEAPDGSVVLVWKAPKDSVGYGEEYAELYPGDIQNTGIPITSDGMDMEFVGTFVKQGLYGGIGS